MSLVTKGLIGCSHWDSLCKGPQSTIYIGTTKTNVYMLFMSMLDYANRDSGCIKDDNASSISDNG